MKLTSLKCPNCSAHLTVAPDKTEAKCEHCGAAFFIDDEHLHIDFDAEQAGYEFEKGRQRAQEEAEAEGFDDYATKPTEWELPETPLADDKPKERLWPWIVGVIALLLVVSLVIGSGSKSEKKKEEEAPAAVTEETGEEEVQEEESEEPEESEEQSEETSPGDKVGKIGYIKVHSSGEIANPDNSIMPKPWFVATYYQDKQFWVEGDTKLEEGTEVEVLDDENVKYNWLSTEGYLKVRRTDNNEEYYVDYASVSLDKFWDYTDPMEMSEHNAWFEVIYHPVSDYYPVDGYNQKAELEDGTRLLVCDRATHQGYDSVPDKRYTPLGCKVMNAEGNYSGDLVYVNPEDVEICDYS